jgi:hypothetical protein
VVVLVRQVRDARPDGGSMDPVQGRQWRASMGVVRPLGLLQLMQELQNLIKLLVRQCSKGVAYLIYRQFHAHFNQPFVSEPLNPTTL